MSKLENIISSSKLLSEEHGLYRPKLEQSVAGILPEVLTHLNTEFSLSTVNVRNNDIEKHLQSSFPSGYDRVIFIIADGVGAQHLEKYGGLLADNMDTKGTVASTMFPSMTSTVMTSLSYGMYPASHGVMGYNFYNEHVGDIWSALAMRYRRGEGDRLVLDDYRLDQLVSGQSLIHQLRGNLPFIAPSQLAEPSLLDLILPGYPIIRYETVEEGIKTAAHLHSQSKTSFVGLYYPFTDHFAHHHGPESDEYQQGIRGLDMMISNLMELPAVKDGSTAIIVTSDHGHSQIDHNSSFWMDRDTWKKHRDDGLLLSTSGRTLHLYCDGDKLDSGRELLEGFADGRGIVIDNTEAMKLAGGEHGGNGFANRMGDLLLVLEDEYLYDIPERVIFEDENRLHGQHGSLTGKELFVPVGIFGGED